MPRIVPLQLLKCLKVLLDDNGGILSAAEVKRIAGLMTKYSKKLVSKCIYVQILKCTKTELLGEFMGVGGWSLVYTWLHDGIRAMNWPLVQEILELLLLCPVDVHRLKINSAPKLVKGLCKDGGNEGVRILAKRLVEQWLKIVTENAATDAALPISNTMPPQQNVTAIPKISPAAAKSAAVAQRQPAAVTTIVPSPQKDMLEMEQDPLADVNEQDPTSFSLTHAQKKANESGLVYKFMIKDGHQVLAKVTKSPRSNESDSDSIRTLQDHDEDITANVIEEDESSAQAEDDISNEGTAVSSSKDETDAVMIAVHKESTEKDKQKQQQHTDSNKRKDSKDTEDNEKEKENESKSKNIERAERKSSKDARDNKDNKKDNKEYKSSSSSHRSSSSSHKSSSSSSKSSSSSSSSKSKSSSSSHRSSSDKHKDRSSSSSSSKDKDRKEGSSSSSNKHRSSSSKSSSSSSSKDRHREKEKDKSSSSASKKDKDTSIVSSAEKDKEVLSKSEKLAKIPKKSKDEGEAEDKPTSITIPSKKASMSIEIRKDTEKSGTVKTYKSQFRSHGLTEEAPPPPSRKGLKKPNSPMVPPAVLPSSLPSSLKRSSPPPRESPNEKKPKIDINNINVAHTEKPGAIKLIPAKKIQTLVETNLFSDALAASTAPKKNVKRKRPTTPGPAGSKDGAASPPTSPDAPKVAPLKFYQDTLNESHTEDKSDKENDDKESTKAKITNGQTDETADDKGNSTEDDDDIPLKKVKEDIEQKVAKAKSAEETGVESIDITSDGESDGVKNKDKTAAEEVSEEPEEPKKPGPGCGPDGPPGVLMLHRRKGPKKKLSWKPQEHLEQIRFFELDENERVNVSRPNSSFMDMKNMERFSERDALNIARRGFNHEDNMAPQTAWRDLIEVDDVPPHPEGNQSKQRKVQADRELTTLRALYFSHGMIPDSPAEAELEPHFAHDIPVIPFDDITGNPDAVNDFTSMPWPEPRGSPKHGDSALAGTGGLGTLGTIPSDIFTNPAPAPANAASPIFNPFIMPMPAPANGPPIGWQNGPPGPVMGNVFNGPNNVDMGPGPGPHFMPHGGQFGPGVAPPYGGNMPPHGFNGPPGPFNGPNHGPGGMMNGMGPNIPMMNGGGPPRGGNMGNNRNNGGGNWRSGSSFHDNSGGGNNWRPAGSGHRGGGGGPPGNNGICKAFMRGHCRAGKSCNYIHPNKSKRI